MLWIVFNKNGQLINSYNVGSVPAAGTNAFEIFAVFKDLNVAEDGVYNGGSIKLYKPDLEQNSYPPFNMTVETTAFDGETNNDLQNGVNYNGLYFDFENASPTILLDTAGLWRAAITLFSAVQSSIRNVVGAVSFNVGNGIETPDNTDMDIDDLLNMIYEALNDKLDTDSELYLKVINTTDIGNYDFTIYSVGDYVLNKYNNILYKLDANKEPQEAHLVLNNLSILGVLNCGDYKIYEDGGVFHITDDTNVNITVTKSNGTVNVAATHLQWNGIDVALKTGALPYYDINLTDNVLDFITNNNANGELVVLRERSGSSKTYLGKFVKAGASPLCNFEFDCFVNKKTYISEAAINLTGLTFNDIFSDTYAVQYVEKNKNDLENVASHLVFDGGVVYSSNFLITDNLEQAYAKLGNNNGYFYAGLDGSYQLCFLTKSGSTYNLMKISNGRIYYRTGLGGNEFLYSVTLNEAYYTKTETDNLLGDKVDKLTTTGTYAYTHNGSTQGELPVATDPESSSLTITDSNGNLHVKTPVNNNHAANKQYVDGFGYSIDLSIDSNYDMVLKLLDKNGNIISQDDVDLPLESIVVSATYYDTYTYDGTTYSKVIVIVLATTSVPTIVPVGDLVRGLVVETNEANKIYGTDSNGDQTTYDKEDFGKVDDVKVNNVSVVTNKVANIDLSDYAKKVGPLPSYTVDSFTNIYNFVTANNIGRQDVIVLKGFSHLNQSTNTIIGRINYFSSGTSPNILYQISFELEGVNNNRRWIGSSVSDQSHSLTFADILNDTYRQDYALESELSNYYTKTESDTLLGAKEDTSNKVTSLSTFSTDTQYPSAKVVWDECQNIREVAEGKCKTYILSYNDTIDSVKQEIRRGSRVCDENGNDITQQIVNGSYDLYSYDNADFNSQDNFIYTCSPGHYLILRGNITREIGFNYSIISWNVFDVSAKARGDIVLVVETDVPDRWCSIGYTFYKMETAKVDLTGYVPTSRTIAGIDLQDDITAQELTDNLVLMNVTTDIDDVMED